MGWIPATIGRTRLFDKTGYHSGCIIHHFRSRSCPVWQVLGEMLQRPDDAGMERGQEKVINQNLDTNFIHSLINNTRSSEGSIHQLHHFMTVRLTSHKKVRQFTGIKDISGRFLLHQLTKLWREQSGANRSQRKINEETGRSAEPEISLNDPLQWSNGCVMPGMCWLLHTSGYLRKISSLFFSYNLFNLITVQKNQANER